MAKSKEYNSNSIQVLDDIAHIRLRPGLYVGGANATGHFIILKEIIDNGIGMEGTRRDSPRSFGLRGMAERMAMLGGEFSIVSQPGKGTLVSARLPVEIGRPLGHLGSYHASPATSHGADAAR